MKSKTPQSSNPWTQDLDYLIKIIQETHPNPYHRNSKEDWDQITSKLYHQMSQLERFDTTEGLSAGHADIATLCDYYQIVALLADSHSRINLRFNSHHRDMRSTLSDSLSQKYPFHGYFFKDGFYLTRSDTPELLGKQVISLNNVPLPEIAFRLEPYVPNENAIGLVAQLPHFLNLPIFLNKIGVTTSMHDDLSLKFSDGSNVSCKPSNKKLLQLFDTFTPAHHWEPEKSLSIRQNEDDLIVDIREIKDTEELTMRQLAEQLHIRLLAEHEKSEEDRIQRLIIDLRQNGGGNNMLVQSLVHTIIKHDWINQLGKVWVLIDRWTFSAAINLATRLEQQTWALFAGEPYSATVNHYGDATRFELPYSKMTVQISTLYWQDSFPKDIRPALIPDLEFVPTYEEFRSGKDYLLDKIKQFELPEDWKEFPRKYTPIFKPWRPSQKRPVWSYFDLNTD